MKPKVHVHVPEYPSNCTGCEHLGWPGAVDPLNASPVMTPGRKVVIRR